MSLAVASPSFVMTAPSRPAHGDHFANVPSASGLQGRRVQLLIGQSMNDLVALKSMDLKGKILTAKAKSGSDD
jgi:hypothetical protein